MSPHALKTLIFLVLGVGLGAEYFRALRWNVRLYCGDGRIAPALLLHIARLLAAAAVFVLIARSGLAPLLSTLVGFQLSKLLAVRAGVPQSEPVS